MNEILKELTEYHQQMIDELNSTSSDPDLEPDLDFEQGYIAGLGFALMRMTGVDNE